MNPKIAVTRALNATRLSHPPTYVATKYLADSLAGMEDSSWAAEVAMRRYHLRDTHGLFASNRFKTVNADGTIELRDMLVPSPVTCLAEALFLHELHENTGYKNAGCVYSHRKPPHDRYPHNFQYYYKGYRERNCDIAKALTKHRDYVAVVVDIEKYYPSIDHGLARERFERQLKDRNISKAVQNTGFALLDHMLAPFDAEKTGIAIGPETSKVIGELALESIDDELSKRYRGRYFRYVDDIVVVVPTQEQKEVLQLLRDMLAYLKLKINKDKTDVVTSEDWLRYHSTKLERIKEDSLESLVFRIKLFLASYPNEFENLRSAFQDEGFSLPLNRFREVSNDKDFRDMVEKIARWIKSQILRDNPIDTPSTLVKRAHTVRETLKSRLALLVEAGVSDTLMMQRWDIQQLRYVTNRAIYMFPKDELDSVRNAITASPKLREFSDTVALIKMLMEDDCFDLLQYPGPAVAMGASILRENRIPSKKINLPKELNTAQVHSAGILLLNGIANLPPKSALTEGDELWEYISFCSGDAMEYRQHRQQGNFGYLDEIRTVQLQRDAESRFTALDQPANWEDMPPLEGLQMGEPS